MKCPVCNHDKERHFDLIDEMSNGQLRGDWGCWICEDNNKTCSYREWKKELEK